tara:strand:- start:9895 stop:10242 length:348 start_codon:yes stop_codon:yes gene_type:complete
MADVEATYPPKFNGSLDTFEQKGGGELDSPAYRAFPITPTNDSNLTVATRGVYIGGDGNVFCRMAGGNASHSEANVFFYQVKAGTVLPIRTDGVYEYNTADTSQNTTATFLVGLY